MLDLRQRQAITKELKARYNKAAKKEKVKILRCVYGPYRIQSMLCILYLKNKKRESSWVYNHRRQKNKICLRKKEKEKKR